VTIAPSISLTTEEHSILEIWARSRNMPVGVVQRAQTIQMAAGGAASQAIIGVSP